MSAVVSSESKKSSKDLERISAVNLLTSLDSMLKRSLYVVLAIQRLCGDGEAILVRKFFCTHLLVLDLQRREEEGPWFSGVVCCLRCER